MRHLRAGPWPGRLLLLFSLCLIRPFPAWAEPGPQAGESQAVLQEAVELCRARALYPPEEAPASDVRGFLRSLKDGYSTYLSREERQELEELDRPDYVGVGMDVIQAPGKGIFVVPFDNGPAHRAGILTGDRLLAVGGQSVAGLSPTTLPPLVRGRAGTTVELTVAGPDGRKRKAKVVRAQVKRQGVEANFDGETTKIRIYRFDQETAGQLAQGLILDQNRGQVIIDLRGNIGGELMAAVEAASLFLPPGALVVSVAGRADGGPLRHYRAGPGGLKQIDRRIIIWQDQMTASASEVFIAALTHHGAATTLGRRTFGKGLVQETFPAPGGGLFIITTGELLAPDGLSFNKTGLPPRLPIRSDAEYYPRTAEAFRYLP